ncbi:MAG: caspase family protein [Magnetococcales bacterium]|nr:caspase family protein [Magnetococcales bacterium]
MKPKTTAWLFLLLLVPWSMAMAADERGLGRIPPGERRVALVIGNNDYNYVEKLRNAVADADAMKKELAALGFEVVYRKNANRKEMNKAITEFTGKLTANAVGLMFYAGHGVQIKSANYLIPVDVEAQEESEVTTEAIDLAYVQDRMSETHAKFSLIILDACRDNPFKGRSSRSLGATRGLAVPSSNASGIMVVFSAGANQQALDRLNEADKNPNGLFTREFLKAIKEPGINVKMAVDNAKQAVIEQAKSVGHQQTPAIYDQSTGSFFFTLPPDRKATVTAEPSGAGSGQTDKETVFWQSVQNSQDAKDYDAYLQQFPTGMFSSLAKNRLEKLKVKPMVVAGGNPPEEEKPPIKSMAVPDEKKSQAEADRKAKEESERLALARAEAEKKKAQEKAESEHKAKNVPSIHGQYIDNGDGTITDSKTGLIGVKNLDCFGEKKWNDAMAAARSLADGSCGLSDGSKRGSWRLPTADELPTLVEWKKGGAFNGVRASSYWSNTTNGANKTYAWSMDLKSGEVSNSSKTGYGYVWPVRGGQ